MKVVKRTEQQQMQNHSVYSASTDSEVTAKAKDSGMQDPEWNGLHCTCGAGAFDDVEHEASCTVTIIRKLERQRDDLARVLRKFVRVLNTGSPLRLMSLVGECGDEARDVLAKLDTGTDSPLAKNV